MHVNFDDESTVEGAVGQFKAAGVAISSIGVQTFKGDLEKEEKWFRFAKMAGASMISVNFDPTKAPGVFASTEKLAEKYDLLLGIHVIMAGITGWAMRRYWSRYLPMRESGWGCAWIRRGVCSRRRIRSSGWRSLGSGCMGCM